MTDMPDSALRLGDVLQRRRVEIDPRYKNLALFARECGLSERLLADLEHGRPSSTGTPRKYRRSTRHALEIAYHLPAGWLAGALASDGGLPPLPPAGPESDPWYDLTEEQLDALLERWLEVRKARREQREQENRRRGA